MMNESRPGRCWYCAEPRLKVGDPPEHVISAALGASLTTDRVCADCNERAGREIDYPFLGDWFIAMDRALYRVEDPRRRRRRPPRAPAQEGQLPDATPVDLHTQDGPWQAQVRSSIEYHGDEVRIRAPNMEEYERLLERVRRRVESEGRTFHPPGEPEVIDSGAAVEMRTQIDGVVWLRSAAKTTLAALSLVLDDAWLDTPDAAMLRGWLWDADPRNADGQKALAFPMEPADLEQHAAQPPDHLIVLTRVDRDVLGVSVAFFGRSFVRSRVELGGSAPPEPGGWRIPISGAAEWIGWSQLLLEATQRRFPEIEDETLDSDPA